MNEDAAVYITPADARRLAVILLNAAAWVEDNVE